MSSEYVILEKDGLLLKKAPAGNWNWPLLSIFLTSFLFFLVGVNPAIFAFLSLFIPLLRGDIKFFFLFWIPFVSLVGVNKYNFWYIKGLLKKGYKIKSFSPALNEHILGKRLKMDLSPYIL